MTKKKDEAPASVVSPAPGYDPYKTQAPPATGTGITAPGSAYGPPAGGAAAPAFGPPPARSEAEFINPTFLWKFGHPVRAIIKGLRDATGTGKEFPGQPAIAKNKRAWFLDFETEEAHPDTHSKECTGRINEGDTRHQKLWAAYKDALVGKTVILRLTTPGDIDPMTNKPSKAAWMLDCQ